MTQILHAALLFVASGAVAACRPTPARPVAPSRLPPADVGPVACSLELRGTEGQLIVAARSTGVVTAPGNAADGSALLPDRVVAPGSRLLLVREGEGIRVHPAGVTLRVDGAVAIHPSGLRVRLDPDGAVRVADPTRDWIDTGWRLIEPTHAPVGPDDPCGPRGLLLVLLGRLVADGM